MAETLTPEEFAQRLDDLSRGGNLRAWLQKEMLLVALVAEREGKLNATRSMGVRTGRLRASIAGRLKEENGMLVVRVSAGGEAPQTRDLLEGSSNPETPRDGAGPVPYARIQEEGGTVVPVRRRWLRIPLGPAKTAAGVDRYPTSLYDFGAGLFHVRRWRDGRLGLHHNETGEPWYVLKSSTTIKPKRYLRRAVDKAVERIPEAIRDAFETAAGGA
jgi:hypothetical protein